MLIQVLRKGYRMNCKATVVVTSLLMSGCSLFASKDQAITIIPSAPNAELFVNGNSVGKGQQSVRLSRGDTYVVLAKCGSSAASGRIDREWSGTGIADMVSGVILLVPLLGLASPEGSHKLTPEVLRITLPDSSGC